MKDVTQYDYIYIPLYVLQKLQSDYSEQFLKIILLLS